jgi:hypothetical protein
MRDLEQIKKINKNPSKFHGEEIHGAEHVTRARQHVKKKTKRKPRR